MRKEKRPINLDISTFRLPITAYVSILHRVTGVANIFVSLILIWLLSQSLSSEDSFEFVKQLFDLIIIKVVIFLVIFNIIYHSCAGIRHLIMDLGIGEDSFNSGRISAFVMIGTVFIFSFFAFWMVFL